MVLRDPVKYATSGDLKIAYQTFGEGPTNLVVVPGFISNLDELWDGASAFGAIAEPLGSVARCVIFDKRGTGLSDREAGFGSLEERADDIRAVMDAAGFDHASLFGISEGGPLSIVFSAMSPERVQSLVLYGTYARILQGPDYPDGIPLELTEQLIQGVEELWGTGQALGAFVQGAPDSEAERARVARYERGAASPRMAGYILRYNTQIDVRPLLPTVTAPTLVLHSAGDRLIPATHGRYLADHIPGAKYIEHDADYHVPFDGASAWFTPEVMRFVSGAEPAVTLQTERFLATVLFTDIVDSTKQAASMGDRAWRDLLDRHDAAARQRIEAFGGRVVKTTGDGVLATLDGPSRAVECAFAIRDEVDGLGLRIRAGVHTGEVERRGDDVGGIGVNIGSRIATLAEPGEVWVSRTVKDLTTGSGLAFADRGRHELKGVPETWELYSLA